jgi:two-component system OmpR family sensor kinase
MISLRKLRQPSLFKRLLVWQTLVVLVALGANFGWNIWLAYQPKTGSIDRSLYLLAEAVARLSALNPNTEHAGAVARVVKQLDKDNATLPTKDTDFAWQVWSTTGQLLSSDGMSNTFAMTPPGSLVIGIRHDQGDWRLMAALSPDGKVWAVVGQTRAFYSQLDALVLRQMVTIPLVYVTVLVIALWLATWRGLKPLQQLGQRIAMRDAGSREPLTDDAHDPLELQPLTTALDAYAVREAELRANEKRFFADAAHELRTPLAVIGAQAHVLSQEQNSTRHPDMLRSLQNGVQRAGDVLSKVLTLSRLDASPVGISMEKTTNVDLGEMLRDRIAEHTPRAMECGIDLGLLESSSVLVSFNVSLLLVAMDNLIDNALLYCPQCSHVDLSWGKKDGYVWWAVEDDGPGIDPEQQALVFERFERGTTSQDVAGSGLGLSIAREVAIKHGGTLRLEAPAARNGCRFVMTLEVPKGKGIVA